MRVRELVTTRLDLFTKLCFEIPLCPVKMMNKIVGFIFFFFVVVSLNRMMIAAKLIRLKFVDYLYDCLGPELLNSLNARS